MTPIMAAVLLLAAVVGILIFYGIAAYVRAKDTEHHENEGGDL